MRYLISICVIVLTISLLAAETPSPPSTNQLYQSFNSLKGAAQSISDPSISNSLSNIEATLNHMSSKLDTIQTTSITAHLLSIKQQNQIIQRDVNNIALRLVDITNELDVISDVYDALNSFNSDFRFFSDEIKTYLYDIRDILMLTSTDVYQISDLLYSGELTVMITNSISVSLTNEPISVRIDGGGGGGDGGAVSATIIGFNTNSIAQLKNIFNPFTPPSDMPVFRWIEDLWADTSWHDEYFEHDENEEILSYESDDWLSNVLKGFWNIQTLIDTTNKGIYRLLVYLSSGSSPVSEDDVIDAVDDGIDEFSRETDAFEYDINNALTPDSWGFTRLQNFDLTGWQQALHSTVQENSSPSPSFGISGFAFLGTNFETLHIDLGGEALSGLARFLEFMRYGFLFLYSFTGLCFLIKMSNLMVRLVSKLFPLFIRQPNQNH